VSLCSPHPPQQRHVLARRVQHDLDRGVGEHLRERGGRGREPRLERVEQRDPHPARSVRVVRDDLHEAQQRAVAALGHELGVDPQAAAGARQRSDPRDLVLAGERGGGRCVHRGA
jgi:hypothetical protein